MGNCSNKLKYYCGGNKILATCVFYEEELPSWSELLEESCVVLSETTKELYDAVTEIKEEIDVTDLESECFDFVEDPETKITVKVALEVLTEKVSELLCPEEVSNNLDLTELDLDYKCLEDACNNPIDNKLKTLLQALIDGQCQEEDIPQSLTNAGAIDLIHKATHVTTTTASAGTLASGREGQYKFIKLIVDGGNFTLAIPGLEGGVQAVFADAGDFLYLLFSAGKWNIITNSGVTIS